MAEVVAFIAAVPAFIQLTKYCGVFAGELYHYSEERDAAKLEIENYANQAKCSSSTIRTSHATLERHHRTHPDSIVLHTLGTDGTLKATVAMSKNISTRLGSVIDNLIDQNDTRSAAVRYVKWRLRKKGVLEILLQLDRVQNSMQLIINLLGLEASELKLSSITKLSERNFNKRMDMKIKALEDHIREQKEVIKDQLKIISRMEKQARRHGIEQEEISHGQRALYRIGNSILVDSTVSLRRERGFRRRNLSRSSSSASSSSSSSFFIGPPPVTPRRPDGPGGSGQPTPTNEPSRVPSVDMSDSSQKSARDESDAGMTTAKGIAGVWGLQSPQDIKWKQEERDERERDKRERDKRERDKREQDRKDQEEREQKERDRAERDRKERERRNLEREIQNLKTQKTQKREHELVHIR